MLILFLAVQTAVTAAMSVFHLNVKNTQDTLNCKLPNWDFIFTKSIEPFIRPYQKQRYDFNVSEKELCLISSNFICNWILENTLLKTVKKSLLNFPICMGHL